MKKTNKKSREKLIADVMLSGRTTGTNSILFHQAVAHILGFNGSEIRCLEVITRAGPSTPSQISKLTGLTTGAVTVLLDRLEEANLIERKSDKIDRRKKVLVPTKLAWQRLGPHYGPMARDMHNFMSTFSDSQLIFMRSLFDQMAEFWKKQTERVLSSPKN